MSQREVAVTGVVAPCGFVSVVHVSALLLLFVSSLVAFIAAFVAIVGDAENLRMQSLRLSNQRRRAMRRRLAVVWRSSGLRLYLKATRQKTSSEDAWLVMAQVAACAQDQAQALSHQVSSLGHAAPAKSVGQASAPAPVLTIFQAPQRDAGAHLQESRRERQLERPLVSVLYHQNLFAAAPSLRIQDIHQRP